ncbi:MAG: hypothetical protein ACOC44_10935 [Promethearchaeia archaeon]
MSGSINVFDKISAGLLLLTGILHIIAPFMLEVMFETVGMVTFGVIYFTFGILIIHGRLRSDHYHP